MPFAVRRDDDPDTGKPRYFLCTKKGPTYLYYDPSHTLRIEFQNPAVGKEAVAELNEHWDEWVKTHHTMPHSHATRIAIKAVLTKHGALHPC